MTYTGQGQWTLLSHMDYCTVADRHTGSLLCTKCMQHDPEILSGKEKQSAGLCWMSSDASNAALAGNPCHWAALATIRMRNHYCSWIARLSSHRDDVIRRRWYVYCGCLLYSPDTFDRVTELGIILSTMPPAYKRLNRDDCVFLFVDQQLLCYLSS